MGVYVVGFGEAGGTDVAAVGGKGANLAELSRLEGVRVPDGFCVSTDAFRRVVGATPGITGMLDRLALLRAEDHEGIRVLCTTIRGVIEGAAIPDEVQEAIVRSLAGLGEEAACAVRSSATAEDSPTASFAGQQDSYLDVVGAGAILADVRRCWASLYTERAVAYRRHQGIDDRRVQMAVVVQKMLVPRASGVLFTADPVSGNRRVSTIEAVFGLGDALVSGRVSPDAYAVRGDRIVRRTIAAGPSGGQVLTDAQIVQLASLGRTIEGHFGPPQDIEWCLVEDTFHVVQSRPITTLYPIPEALEPGNRVYVCVGHGQMMTDAMKPLGLSLFRATAARPMVAAGGRLFVDVTKELASPASRGAILDVMGRGDPLIGDALTTLLARGDFIAPTAPATVGSPPGRPHLGVPAPIEADPAIVAALITRDRAAVETLERGIRKTSGAERMDLILEDVQRLKRSVTEPQSFAVILGGMSAATWLNEQMLAWLGEKNAADTLAQSAPDNVTAEMGLALLDLADVIRPHPEVVAWLATARDEDFPEALLPLDGGPEVHRAMRVFLDRYGMRCVGEIDVTRPRWREAPTALVPVILSHIRNFTPGEAARRFEEGRLAAARMEARLLERLVELPDGEAKAEETRGMIRRLRTFAGYREYPKYGIVSRYLLYKEAFLAEAARLVDTQVIHARDDIDYLTLEELREVVRTQALDQRIVHARRAEHARDCKLTPPRVLTSDGEIIVGAYRRSGLPAAALVGLPVSTGLVEGRARVLSSLADAVLETGDILVTAFTDPSWTPAFVAVAGLVTEVGGLMTHGAVIAREYGLPAVVGVENATRLIRDGQRIRVNGTDGYVELLG